MPNPTRQFVEGTLVDYIDVGLCDVEQIFRPQNVTLDDRSSGDGGYKVLKGVNRAGKD